MILKKSKTPIVRLLIFPHCIRGVQQYEYHKMYCVRLRVCTCVFCPSRDMIIVCCDIVMKPSGPLKLISLSLSLCADRSVVRAVGRTVESSTASAFWPSLCVTHIPCHSCLTCQHTACLSISQSTLPFQAPAVVSCRSGGDDT